MSDERERSDGVLEPSSLDDETLAAFVDGVLEGEERDRVLRAIDRDPDVYRAFLDTSALVEELAAHEEAGDVSPAASGGVDVPRRRWSGARRVALLSLAASVLLLVVTLPIGSRAPDAAALAAHLDLEAGTRFSDGLGADLRLGFQSSMTPVDRSLFLGAFVVDLEVARRVGDEVATRRAAGRLREVAATIELPRSDLDLLVRAERGDAPSARALETLESRLRVRSDRRAFDAGRVLEAVRLASVFGDREYAERPPIRRALRRAQRAGFALDSLGGS